MKTIQLLLTGAALGGLTAISAFAQGTAFTYQGVLNAGPNPATGVYDLRFGLWNSPDTGNSTQLGLVTNAATRVTNGLFTVTLDFGFVWPGPDRWLEVAVRTNGAVNFDTLGPRQFVAPTPYAIYADNSRASGLRGLVHGGQIAPGTIGTLQLSNNLSLWDRSGSDIYYTNGNVAVGTATPAGRLSVGTLNGTVSIADDDFTPALVMSDGPTPGVLRVRNALEIWPNTAGTSPGNVDVRRADGTPTVVLSGASGTVTAASFVGDGGALTGIDASQVTAGTLDDGRLSATVARRTTGNTFTGNQIITGGRVGIGTASPDRPLAVQAIGSNGEWISLKDTNGSTKWHLNNAHGGLDLVQSGVADARLFLATNGNVGIGTAAPANRLQVAGPVAATGFSGDGSGLTSLNAASVTGTLPDARLSGNVALRSGGNGFTGNQIITNGRIGIGATDPAAGLHVLGSGFFGDHQNALPATAGAGIRIFRDAGTGVGNIFAYDYGASGALNLILQQPGGNVGIGTTTPATKLDVAGEITCTAVNLTSDRNAKEQFKPVNAREVLDKVARLPISEWQYKAQGDARHIGPMAQDFREAFSLGRDDKHITSVDADGVALAAIQGLNEKLEEKNREVEALKQTVQELKALVHEIARQQSGGVK